MPPQAPFPVFNSSSSLNHISPAHNFTPSSPQHQSLSADAIINLGFGIFLAILNTVAVLESLRRHQRQRKVTIPGIEKAALMPSFPAPAISIVFYVAPSALRRTSRPPRVYIAIPSPSSAQTRLEQHRPFCSRPVAYTRFTDLLHTIIAEALDRMPTTDPSETARRHGATSRG